VQHDAGDRLCLALAVFLPLAAIYVLCPDAPLWAYGHAHDSTADAVPRKLAAVLLRFVAFYSLFDAMNVMFAGAVKRAGDTRFAMLTTVSAALGAAGFIWISQEWLHLGLHGAWFVVTGWISVLGIVFLLRI